MIYHAAGYVIRQPLKKFKMADDDRGAAITSMHDRRRY